MPLAPPVTSATLPSSLTGAQPLHRLPLRNGVAPGPARAPRAVQMCQWIANPIPFLGAAGRRSTAPMFTVRFVIGDMVFISDPALIKQVFTGDPGRAARRRGQRAPLEPIVGRNSVLLLDGPEHLRQRKLMLPSFHGERMRATAT